MEYNFNFKGKSVLITGAASGIGLEAAKASGASYFKVELEF